MNTILQTSNLSIGYNKGKRNENIILSDINLGIEKGCLVCLLGPNGSGKSTLMRTIAGLQAPLNGHTLVGGKPIVDSNFKEIAKLLSIVLTDKIDVGNLTVEHIVSLGRHPHTSWMGRLSKNDQNIIDKALHQVGMSNFSSRFINELSDGERQRVMIAKALAQDTPLVMLDEPTAHLDLPNRVEIMKLLQSLAHDTNKAIFMSTHELDLALQAADRIWLMSKKAPIQVGVPEDLVLNGKIEDTFANNSFRFDKKTGNFIINYSEKAEIQLVADDEFGFWTQRALAREGYRVTCEEVKGIKICVDPLKNEWKLILNNIEHKFYSIEELLKGLRKLNI